MKFEKLLILYADKRVADQVSVHTLIKENWLMKKIREGMDVSMSVAEVRPLDVTQFIRNLRRPNGDKYATATVDSFTPLFKGLFEYAVSLGEIDVSPAAHLKRKRPVQSDDRIADGVAVADVTAAFEAYLAAKLSIPQLAWRSHIVYRDVLAVSFSVDSGGRRGEIHNLRLSSLAESLARPRATPYGVVYHVRSVGKSGDVVLRFGERTASYLHRYLAVRPSSSSDMLMVNHDGRHCDVSVVNRAFVKLCDFAGVDLFQSHGVRHLNITEMMRAGADPKAAAAYANHADEQITLAIYRHLQTDEVDDAMARLMSHRENQSDYDDLARLFGVK